MTGEEFDSRVYTLHNVMYGAALTMLRDEDEAADAVQDALLSLWELRDRLDSIENLEGYCLTACRRKAFDRLRHSQVSPLERMADYFDACDTAITADRDLDARNNLDILKHAIDQLPENQKTAITLSAFNSLENNEIATQMGLTEGNVRVLLFRARKKLRNLFLQLQ